MDNEVDMLILFHFENEVRKHETVAKGVEAMKRHMTAVFDSFESSYPPYDDKFYLSLTLAAIDVVTEYRYMKISFQSQVQTDETVRGSQVAYALSNIYVMISNFIQEAHLGKESNKYLIDKLYGLRTN